MATKLKLIVFELGVFLALVIMAMIMVLLISWVVWILFIYYLLDDNARSAIQIAGLLLLTVGGWLWLIYRREP